MADPYFSQVQLLVGVTGGVIADESDAARTPTLVGSAAADATNFKYGTHSIRIPDTSSSASLVTFPDDASLEFGSNPWTIECFVRMDALSAVNNQQHTILAKYDDNGGGGGWYLYYFRATSGEHRFVMYMVEDLGGGGDTILFGSNADLAQAATWQHVAVDFDGTTYRLYVDGTMVDSDTTSLTAIRDVTAPVAIGGRLDLGAPKDTMRESNIDEVRITVGTARYATDTSFTPPEQAFPREGIPPETILESVSDGIDMFSLAGEFTNDILWNNSSDTIEVTPEQENQVLMTAALGDIFRNFAFIAASKGYPTTVAEGIDITPEVIVARGQVLAEVIRVSETRTITGIYGKSLVDATQLRDTLSRAMTGGLADTVDVSEAVVAAVGLVVLDQLEITPAIVSSGLYGRSLADGVRLAESLARFFGGDLSDGLTMAEALVSLARRPGLLSDTVEIAETQTPTLLMSVAAADSVEITPEEAVNFLFSDTLAEGVEIIGGLFDPSGDLVTWTMNTRTAAVTNYSNFDFNSFGRLGSRYVGANSTGLYELYGDTDDGDDIIATLRGGYIQFGGTKLSRLKAVYIAARGEGDFVLKIEDGEGRRYNYAVSTRNTRSTKVHMGKGQRARYFAYELVSAGQDFDLDTLEFVPVVMRRRV